MTTEIVFIIKIFILFCDIRLEWPSVSIMFEPKFGRILTTKKSLASASNQKTLLDPCTSKLLL